MYEGTERRVKQHWTWHKRRVTDAREPEREDDTSIISTPGLVYGGVLEDMPVVTAPTTSVDDSTGFSGFGGGESGGGGASGSWDSPSSDSSSSDTSSSDSSSSDSSSSDSGSSGSDS